MLVFLFGVTKGTAAEGGMYKCFIHCLLLFFKNQLVEEQLNTKFWKRNPPFRFDPFSDLCPLNYMHSV